MFMNCNKYKSIENWSREPLLNSAFKFSEYFQLSTNVTWHNAYCQVKQINPKLNLNSIIKCNMYIQMKMMVLSI
jgi:hypothetical protein